VTDRRRPLWFGLGGILVVVAAAVGEIASQTAGDPAPGGFWLSDPMLVAYGLMFLAVVCGMAGVLRVRFPLADRQPGGFAIILADVPPDSHPPRSLLGEALDAAAGPDDLRDALDDGRSVPRPRIDLDPRLLDGLADPAEYPRWCRKCGLGLRADSKYERRCQNNIACDKRHAIRSIEGRLLDGIHKPASRNVHPAWLIANYPGVAPLVHTKFPSVRQIPG
jgi:hypothetical protein